MNRVYTGVLILLIAYLPQYVQAAEGGVLYVSPERGTRAVGETFEVHILMDTNGARVNAAEAQLEFNPVALSVEGISTEGSLLKLWPTPPNFSNANGTIEFSGLMDAPFSGSDGLLITITFKALRNMSTTARLAAGAMIAADGQGSNIITTMRSGVYVIKPKEIVRTEEEIAAEEGDIIPSEVDIVPFTMSEPVFKEYSDTLMEGDRIVVKGTAEPNAKISVWVQKGADIEVRSDVVSASDGSFTYVSDKGVTEGVYRISARVEDGEGHWGPKNEQIHVTVRSPGFFAAAVLGVSFISEMVPILGFLIFVGLGTGYFIHRMRIEKIRPGR